VVGDCVIVCLFVVLIFVIGNGEFCGEVKVLLFMLDEFVILVFDEVVYGFVFVIEGSNDGIILVGKIVWFYDFKC